MYFSLHVHTAKGSVGDSILKIPDYISKAKEYGLSSIAITDHGSLSAIYSFYEACKKQNIKPIIGCEVYFCDDNSIKKDRAYSHLILLAKDETGLNNLIAITNDANINGFYYKPRTDLKHIREHKEGLICLSACIAGPISQLIIADKEDEALEKVREFKEVFGNDFYLEIQPGNFGEQVMVNTWMLSKYREGIANLVVTNDVHYLNQEDWYYHDLHCKIKQQKSAADPEIYPDHCYWFMPEENILSLFESMPKYYGEFSAEIKAAIHNTCCIAEQCNVTIDNQIRMPKINLNNGKTEEETLTEICYNSFNREKKDLKDPARYIEQMLYELKTINDLGFAGYFLIVKDFIDYAKENDIPVGPGRGSVCGSIISRFTGISAVDPLQHGLLFERFLSPQRKGSIPDIDTDFSAERRPEMFDYVNKKYGIDHCAFVSTQHMRKAKGAIRDCGRILGLDLKTVNAIAGLIPDSYYEDDGSKAVEITLKDCLRWMPEFRKYKQQYPKLFDAAEHLEGLPTTNSIHAAGIIISPVPLIGILPLIRSEGDKEGYLCSSLDLHDAESFGVVKFDFLSIGSLSVYDKTEKDSNFVFDYENDKYDDPQVWDLIGSNFTTGIFQLSSFTYKKRMPRLRPRNLDQLAACLALVRGPCIMSGMDEQYMQVVEGKAEIQKLHPLYDSVTADTNGAILYQEQIMKIIVNFGFDIETSYRVMKMIAKKKVKELAAFEKEFKAAAEKKHVPADILKIIWDRINDCGLYSFGASHAFAYAQLAYKSAYLKVHSYIAFMKNTLFKAYADKTKTRDKKIAETYKDIKRLKITILPPDINLSSWENSLEDNKIRLGFCAIKSFGQKAYEDVEKTRLEKEFSSFQDFYDRVPKSKCNKAKILVGIYAGLFDLVEPESSRLSLQNMFHEFRKDKEADTEIKIGKDKIALDQSNVTIQNKILNLRSR